MENQLSKTLRVTVIMDRKLHKQLKGFAVEKDTTITALIIKGAELVLKEGVSLPPPETKT